jgi:MFS family permease
MDRSPALDVLFGQNHGVLTDPNFQLILLANLAAPLGTALVSPLLDSLTTPFGVSSTNVGLMVTMSTAPGIFIIPLSGFLTDYYGRKPVLLFGLLLFGSAGTAIAFTTDFRVALGLRALQGPVWPVSL